MTLTDDQQHFYEQTLEMTRKQLTEINAQIEEELAKVKERLADLQAKKNAILTRLMFSPALANFSPRRISVDS